MQELNSKKKFNVEVSSLKRSYTLKSEEAPSLAKNFFSVTDGRVPRYFLEVFHISGRSPYSELKILINPLQSYTTR